METYHIQGGNRHSLTADAGRGLLGRRYCYLFKHLCTCLGEGGRQGKLKKCVGISLNMFNARPTLRTQNYDIRLFLGHAHFRQIFMVCIWLAPMVTTYLRSTNESSCLFGCRHGIVHVWVHDFILSRSKRASERLCGSV